MRSLVAATGLLLAASAAAAAVLMIGVGSAPVREGRGSPAADGTASPAAALKPEDLWRLDQAAGVGAGDAAAAPELRRIAPETFPAPSPQTAALTRTPPRAPLGPLGIAKAPDPANPVKPQPVILRYRLLHRPVATAAGFIEVEGFKIRLAGIEPVPADKICGGGASPAGEDGTATAQSAGSNVGGSGGKPCGMMARTAFRNWLRGRSVNCAVPDVVSDKEIETECSVAGEDMASWLVVQGWAEPLDGKNAELAAKSSAAASAKRGMHGL